MQKYIGRQLKTARLNKKLTQEQIADCLLYTSDAADEL